jgi:cellular nucleic acid-binding protein
MLKIYQLSTMFVYILQLEGGRYYVGSSNSPYKRINQHFNNEGSTWTKIHKPIEIVEIIPNCDNYDEDKYTKIYMDKYGVDKVRGGSYCTMNLDKNTLKHLEREKRHCKNKCYKCGETGHYADVCDEIKACMEDYEKYLYFEEINECVRNYENYLVNRQIL